MVLCQEHHGEAHTKRKLSLTLTAARIQEYKKSWETEVRLRREATATVSHQRSVSDEFMATGISWGYINHRRVAGMISEDVLSRVDKRMFAECLTRNLIDQNGIIVSRPFEAEPSSYLGASIYDRFDFGDDHRVHTLYSGIVDILAHDCSAIHIDDYSFTKAWISDLLRPGTFIFLNRGHYFRDVTITKDNIVRLAYVKKRKVKFEYIIETRDMFGTSSMTVSFKGRRSAAALLMVKSINVADNVSVDCTPIALGAGQWTSARP